MIRSTIPHRKLESFTKNLEVMPRGRIIWPSFLKCVCLAGNHLTLSGTFHQPKQSDFKCRAQREIARF